MRHSLSSRAAGLALVAVLAGHAAAGITTVSSSDDATADAIVSAAVGSVLTIDGDGFGTAKPKVFLTDVNLKKYILKVTAFSDTQITAEIKKAAAGDLTLNVQPKGADPFTFDAVTIEAPAIDQLLDHVTMEEITSATQNMEFMITGSFFGSKKGKIFIGGKKAKVASWAGDEIHLFMPKPLASGLWDILLDNKIATDADEQITMTGSLFKVGKAGLTITFGEGDDAVTIKFKYGGEVAGAGIVAFGGSTTGDPVRTVVLKFPFDVAGGTVPSDVLSTDPAVLASYTLNEKPLLAGKTAVWLLAGGVAGLTFHVNQSGGGQVGGTFEGDLPLQVNTTGHAVDDPMHVVGSWVYQP